MNNKIDRFLFPISNKYNSSHFLQKDLTFDNGTAHKNGRVLSFSFFFYRITEAIRNIPWNIPKFKSNVDGDINKYEEDNGNENRGKPETGVYYSQ